MPKEKGNWQIKKTTVVLIAAVVFVILATILLPNRDIWPLFAAGEDMMNEVEGYWWAPNGGWIDMDWDDVDDQDVQIDKSPLSGPPVFTGFAWGPNIGWISMADTSGGDQYKVFLRDNVPLTGDGPWPIDGYAWGPNIGWISFDAIDAWDHAPGGNCWPWHVGCTISADEPQIKVDVASPEDANMAGYAWSPNFGWIDLSLATVPGWKDVTDPTLEYFNVEPEVQPLPPSEKYASGVYKEEDPDGCCGGATYNFPQEHLVWVRPGIEFKATMHSQDNRTRQQDLNISVVTAQPQTLPAVADYIWWDRIRFRPNQTPLFIGNVKSYNGALNEFLPNPNYAEGNNPNVPKTGGEIKVPAEEDINGDGQTETIWKSMTHFLSGTPGAANYVLREFRYNVRDAGGNFACSDDPVQTFDWDTGRGCIIPSLPDPYSPMTGRVGVAVDKIQPAGLLYVGATSLPDDEEEKPPTHISATEEIDFKVEYIDTEAGSYHVILDYCLGESAYCRGASDAWHQPPIGERRWNRYRNPESWIIEGVLNPEAETETETPLDTSDWAEGQQFTLRLRVFDNVGNEQPRFFPAVIDRTPPDVKFAAHDPIDDNPSRTRYNAADLIIPMCLVAGDCVTMQFSNDGQVFTPPEPYTAGRKEDWFMGENVTGGIKTIYGRFCDGTIPDPVCVNVPTTIAAPWFEGVQGDVYGRSGVGTRNNPQFEGIAPYYNPVGVKKYNATYRITSDGEIKPQITSAQGWTESNYYDFGYPGTLSTIAPIDFQNLQEEAYPMRDNVIASQGEIDFTDHPTIWLQSGSLVPNTDPRLYTSGDHLTIIGTGTLLVDGNLRIETNLYYQDTLAQPVTDIDSMAVLTSRNNSGHRGNVYVSQNVAHLVGAYIIGLGDGAVYPSDTLGSGTFHSSAVFSSGSDVPGLTPAGRELVVEGMVAARDFNLGRYSTGNQNFSQNSSFEGNQVGNCIENWTCTGSDRVTFTRRKGSNDSPVVFGERKLQIKVPAGSNPTGSITQFVEIPLGQNQATASFYLRSVSSELAIPDPVYIRIDDNDCSPTQPEGTLIDYQWRRFQCTKAINPGSHSFSLAVHGQEGLAGGYVLEVDGVQFEGAGEATEWHLQFDATDTNYMAAERFYYDGRVIISTPPGLASTSNSTWEEGVAD